MSSPSVPPPPPPPQDAKPADSIESRRAQRKTGPAATVLTGPAGVAQGALNTGGNTLLGS